ncbi:hypothetical protein ACIQI7_29015 [Kitasatospora sp. NPDC092039]
MTAPLFAPGGTAVRRDAAHGRTWSAMPYSGPLLTLPATALSTPVEGD